MTAFNSEYKIERLDESKLKDAETLYKAVYKRASPKNYFQKKYNTNYTGKNYIAHIAYNNENFPLAFYGVLPCFVQYKEKNFLCAQAVDGMTHPSFRYKGMFLELLKTTSHLCKAEGIEFIFGFPNKHSHQIMVNKDAWTVTDQMEYFKIPVNTLPIPFFLKRFNLTNYFYKQYSKFILRKFFIPQHGLPNVVTKEGFAGVYRNEKYLEYKTYNKTEVIKIGNAKVWFKITHEFVIGDIELNGLAFDKLIATLKKIATHLGLSQIIFQTCPGTKLYMLFSEKFKSSPSFPVIIKNLGTDIQVDKLKFTFADIDIF